MLLNSADTMHSGLVPELQRNHAFPVNFTNKYAKYKNVINYVRNVFVRGKPGYWKITVANEKSIPGTLNLILLLNTKPSCPVIKHFMLMRVPSRV